MHAFKQKLKQAIAGVALFCTATQPTLAALINLSAEPLFLAAAVTPKVMLTISKDQQLFKKAYNDYSDLDGDGAIETTYKHSISYYGYFDPQKCYEYNVANGQFEPRVRNTVTVMVGTPPVTVDRPGLCTNQWSGNFLNWVSMTRMDAVRKLLYGGMRSTDESFQRIVRPNPITVLERAYLPTDAHAWAKYYNPAAPGSNATDQPPIDRLTPFAGIATAPASTPATTAAFPIPAASGDFDITFVTVLGTFRAGDQISMTSATGSFTGAVLSITGPIVRVRVNIAGVAGSGSSTSWTVQNLSSTGISFCNVTTGAPNGPNQRSSTNTQPPLIRAVRGNFALWNANERLQCLWFEERNNLQVSFNGIRSNGNISSLSGIAASAENPVRAAQALSAPVATFGEYIARVQVCVSVALTVTEKCRRYPNGNLKPFGLLQEYGDDNRIHFGLMTGSYSNNTQGGVLRKNIGTFTDEVNETTDGTFANVNHYRPPNGVRNPLSPATVPGIVNSLNYMRIYGYDYSNGTYRFANGDNCDFQLTNITPGSCTSWGNPMAEAFFESLRYFAAQSPQYVLNAPTGRPSKDNELGLPVAAWTDPMANTLYCAKLNVLVFNASVSTNDDDLRSAGTGSINGTTSVSALTTAVGNFEGITGNRFFIGKTLGAGGTAPGATDFELCTPKTIGALGEVSGICPEGPTLAGSYLMAGLAHHARTNRIRTTLPAGVSLPPPADTTSLKVNSYGIQLATNTPEISLPIPGRAGQRVVIQPIYRLVVGGALGGGALVDLKFVSQTSDATTGIATGKVYVNWEDSEQGGDYDQDMWGTIEWRIDANANTIAITTNAVSASTANPQGFGYTISGTNRDGPHFHSGILGFNFNDPTGAVAEPGGFSGDRFVGGTIIGGIRFGATLVRGTLTPFAGCRNCRTTNELDPLTRLPSLPFRDTQIGPQAVTYSLGATAAGSLKDPMWYLAKYGGFKDTNGNNIPDLATEWDSRLESGVLGTDGIPDNYFLVTNPLGLEASLRAAFDDVTRNATAASVAANTTSLQASTAVYSASFDPSNWSGNLEAQPVRADGTLGTATWDAQTQLNLIPPANRNILTFDDSPSVRDGTRFLWQTGGVPFAIPTTLRNFLNTSPDTGVPDGRGQERLDYLRGDRTNEFISNPFRARSNRGTLGDIINSNPAFVPAPNATILDSAYQTFRNSAGIADRMQMVYVASNDGMLHGFNAATGREQIAYVPSKTFRNLNTLTSTGYIHRSFVDGSPEVGDAIVNGQYRTVLVGGLGGGGQGLYALDVSRPDTFASTSPRDLVLWEFNDTDDADLGYVLGQPVIRRMANGRWAAIVSGGYNNSEGDGRAGTGRAFLFVIFLDGPTGSSGPGGRTWQQGTDYIKIDTGVGSVATPNGLARPLAADTDANGRIDYVYAGDLRGNLWKFDLSSSDTRDWVRSSRLLLLFRAVDGTGAPQPITAQAEGSLHPSGRGFIINFGTGKYLETSDKVGPFQVQSFYGIWDKNDRLGLINAQTRVEPAKGRTQLLQQTAVDSVVGGRTVRGIETPVPPTDVAEPIWSIDTTPPFAEDSPDGTLAVGRHLGWYLDFPNAGTSGERAVFVPLIRGGRLIFTTLIPSADPCQFGGSSVLMLLDPASGYRFSRAVIDTSGDGRLDSSDAIGGSAANPVYASGLQSEVGITNTPRLIARPVPPPPPGGAGSVLGRSDPRSQGAGIRESFGVMRGSGNTPIAVVLGLGGKEERVSWREVVKD